MYMNICNIHICRRNKYLEKEEKTSTESFKGSKRIDGRSTRNLNQATIDPKVNNTIGMYCNS
jgi:hypothetical protein